MDAALAPYLREPNSRPWQNPSSEESQRLAAAFDAAVAAAAAGRPPNHDCVSEATARNLVRRAFPSPECYMQSPLASRPLSRPC
jgi:hypothetical protein